MRSLEHKVAGLSTTEFSVLVAVLIAIAGVFFIFIWRWYHRARVIEDTPTANVRSAHQGYVELEGIGRMMEGEPIAAPLTSKPCLWFRYKIEEQQMDQRDRSHNRWRVVRSGVSDHLFWLDDGTGTCVIDPDGAEITPNERQVWYGNDAWPQNNPAVTTVGGVLFGMGRFRYTEERLVPGRLYALGWFGSVSHVEGDISHHVSSLLRSWKLDKRELLKRFDANRDGDIDPTEWETAVEAANREVLRERGEKSRESHIHILHKPPHKGKPFIISPEPQEKLVWIYKRKSLFALTGVFVVVGAILWVFSVRL